MSFIVNSIPEALRATLCGPRNFQGLDDAQIERCKVAWAFLSSETMSPVQLDISKAKEFNSSTFYDPILKVVFLGSNVYPGEGSFANCRLSYFSCLAHEYTHAQRDSQGLAKPYEWPDLLIDEAETSLGASYTIGLGSSDVVDLREDAKDRITTWLAIVSNQSMR
jgi:hypothetical protein